MARDQISVSVRIKVMAHVFCLWLLSGAQCYVSAEEAGIVIPFWDQGAPGFEQRKDEAEQAESYWVRNIHFPTLTAYLPDPKKANGTAVIIAPGGGHRELVFKAEGIDAAQYLSSIGVAAFALKYRLGREEGSPYKIEQHALEDGQRAVRLVRHRAAEWGIDPTRVGMLGFSAGGEVVSMIAYATESAGSPAATDPIDRENARLDFQMLVYPGPLGIPVALPRDAPPAFLLVANDDRGVAAVIYDLLGKLRTAGVPVEAHVYAQVGHAFNMGNRSQLVTPRTWPQRASDWMRDSGLLDPTNSGEAEAPRQPASR